MGGGKEKKKTNQMIDEQNKWARQQSNAYNQIAQPQQQQAVNAANNIQQSTFNNLNKVGQGAGWIDPALRERYLASLGGGGGGGPDMSGYDPVQGLYSEFAGQGGGVDAGPIRAAMGAMRGIAESGGWSPEDRAKQNEIISQFEAMGKTGGLDADAMNRMRGGGVFEEFQKTGGYTPEQIADIRTRATSTIPAYYDAIRQGQNRMASIQGGNPAASAAMAARLGRDQAKGLREQSLDAELGIGQQVREGRQWGAGAGAEAENALQGLRTSNMLSGLRGGADTRGNMLNTIAANQLRGSEGWTQGELGIADLIQQGRFFGTKGLEGVAGARASAGGGGGGNDETRGLQWLANFEAGNTMDAAGGMTDLYRAAPGEVNMWNQALLGNRGQQMQDTQSAVGNRMQNNPQRDWMATIGGLAGAAGGAMTGLGALGVGSAAARRPPV